MSVQWEEQTFNRLSKVTWPSEPALHNPRSWKLFSPLLRRNYMRYILARAMASKSPCLKSLNKRCEKWSNLVEPLSLWLQNCKLHPERLGSLNICPVSSPNVPTTSVKRRSNVRAVRRSVDNLRLREFEATLAKFFSIDPFLERAPPHATKP